MFASVFFFSSRRRHTRCYRDWSSDVCSSDLPLRAEPGDRRLAVGGAALEAPGRSGQSDGRGRQRGGGPGVLAAGRPAADQRARAGAGAQDVGGGNPPGGPRRGKKKTALLRRVPEITRRPMTAIFRTL